MTWERSFLIMTKYDSGFELVVNINSVQVRQEGYVRNLILPSFCPTTTSYTELVTYI